MDERRNVVYSKNTGNDIFQNKTDETGKWGNRETKGQLLAFEDLRYYNI